MTKLFLLVALVPMIGCGGDDGGGGGGGGAQCGDGTTLVGDECVPDVTCGDGTVAMDGTCVPAPPGDPVFHQIEQLARPGIAEALLLSNPFLDGYNATAPTFAGVPAATLDQVVGQAKTVLQAVYLGSCLLNGALGLDAGTGVHPAGATCNAVGGGLFTENAIDGVTLTQATKDAAAAYADRVFAQFEPDVMRIDVGTAGDRPVSTYETLCGDPTQPLPLLCGGRGLRDDVIDVTYDYLINGAGTCAAGLCGATNQVNALVSDGVVFDPANNASNVSSRQNGDATNPEQGHVAITDTFPYSAPPL